MYEYTVIGINMLLVILHSNLVLKEFLLMTSYWFYPPSILLVIGTYEYNVYMSTTVLEL